MPDLSVYVQVATIVSALAKALDTGLDYFQALKDVESDPIKLREDAVALQNTYDESEIGAISGRIQGCRDRFLEEGHGENRVRCLCSVLRDASAGNGGTMPIDDWQKMFEKLRCASMGSAAAAASA